MRTSLKVLKKKATKMAENENKFHLILAGRSIEAYYLKKVKEDWSVPIVIMGTMAIRTCGFVDNGNRPIPGMESKV